MENFRLKMRQDCCFIPKFVFKCLGMSMNGNRSKIYDFYSKMMIALASLYPFVSLHMILHNLDNFDLVVNGLFNIGGGIAGLLKIIVLVRKRKGLQRLLAKIQQAQEELNVEQWSQNEIYGTNKKILIGTLLFYVPLIYFYGNTLTERFMTGNSQQWRTPIVDVTVINITYSPNYEIAWIYEVLSSIMISSCFCISDFLVAGVLIDLALQFKILSCKIKQTFDDRFKKISQGNGSASKEQIWKSLEKRVNDVVVHHLFLIDLSNDAEKACSYLVFFDVTGNMILICFAVYYASVLPLFDFKALQSYFEMCMLTLTVFIMCYCGSEISLASESIAAACYETEFIGTDVRFQKSLILIMIRSQKPIKMTVGRFTGLSISVFVWIIRSSYSYFMVLRNSNQSR